MGKAIPWNSSEQKEQEAVMQWAATYAGRYPELDLLYHVPNGGWRGKAEAGRLQRAGVKAGVPDLCLPCPRQGWHGLYVELKYGRNKTSEAQDNWLARLTEQEYLAVVCYGWQDAVDTIKDYLGIVE